MFFTAILEGLSLSSINLLNSLFNSGRSGGLRCRLNGRIDYSRGIGYIWHQRQGVPEGCQSGECVTWL